MATRTYKWKHQFQVMNSNGTMVESALDSSGSEADTMQTGGTFSTQLTNTSKKTIALGNIGTTVIAFSMSAVDSGGKSKAVDVFIPSGGSKIFATSRLMFSNANSVSSLAVQYTDATFFATSGSITITVIAYGN